MREMNNEKSPASTGESLGKSTIDNIPQTGSLAKISTLEMSRADWLELRRRGIGGSDAATIVGLNPWSSRLELYADKKGLLPEKEDNEAMRQGRDFEDYVAQRWMEATGKKVRRENHILYNSLYPWAFANVDRVVIGEKALLECKTTSVYNKTDFAAGKIPDTYYVQCQHYLAVTGYERAYLAVLVLNSAFYTFTIERDENEIAALMGAEKAFWTDHVQAGVEPAPDGSDSAQRVLERMERMEGTALLMEHEGTFEAYQMLNDQIKALETERDQYKQTIIQALGANERGQSYTWQCSYLPQTRNSVDSKKLQAAYPMVYADVAKQSTSTIFRATKKKEK